MLEGELTMKRDGRTRVLSQGETAVIEPNVWHDWWNASNRDARVRARSLAHSHRSRAGAAIARPTRSSRASCWRLERSGGSTP
ncbi:MAG: cupin domain-containing protein [Gemmatimonadales bacterium]